MSIKSFRDLIVWQKAMDLVESVYATTEQLPNNERYGLSNQLQRAVVSVPSNIAEGCQRNNRKEFKQFCGIAYGSSAEVETQLLIAERIYKVDVSAALSLVNEIQKMLRQLIVKLTTNH